MFSFNALNDIDLDSYAYQLYDNALGTGTPVAQGRNKANVFTVSVPNSTDSVTKRYWGRVAPVNSAGVVGSYTSLISDQATPQIGSQYISTLTADKIRAGTIGAYEIVLNGSGSILKSSNYQTGLAGWKITGAGDAEFNDLTIRTSLDIGGNDTTSFHVDNAGNMWLGSGVLNYSTAPFRVSNAGALVATNANITGAITATSGTFAGTVRGGDIYIGGTDTSNAPFKVDTSGNLTATSANITGVISASSGNIAGINIYAGKLYAGVGNWANADTGFYLDLNGYFSLKNKFYWDPTALSGAGQATFAGALSGASGSVTSNFSIGTGCTIGGSLSVGDNVRINNATGDGSATVFKVRGNGTSNSKWIAKFQNNTPTDILSIRDDGLVTASSNLTVDGDLTVNSQQFISVALSTNTDPALRVNRSYDANGGYFVEFTNTNGTVRAGYIRYVIGSNNSVYYSTSSDARLKDKVDIETTMLNKIKKLKPTHYRWKNSSPEHIFYGFLAQELYETIPEAVAPGDNTEPYVMENGQINVIDSWGVDYGKIVPYLVKAVQELSAKIDELESRLI